MAAAERDAAFKLLGNRFGDESRVKLGLANLDDVEDDVAVGEFRHRLAELLDVGALLADDDAGPRRMDRHAALLVRPSITILDTAACLSCLVNASRISMSSCKSLPYSFLPAYHASPTCGCTETADLSD